MEQRRAPPETRATSTTGTVRGRFETARDGDDLLRMHILAFGVCRRGDWPVAADALAAADEDDDRLGSGQAQLKAPGRWPGLGERERDESVALDGGGGAADGHTYAHS